jgi:hypothetical protein
MKPNRTHPKVVFRPRAATEGRSYEARATTEGRPYEARATTEGDPYRARAATTKHRRWAHLGVLVPIAALVSSVGCLSNAPRIANPSLRVAPGQSALLERDAWHFDRRSGDRYAVAGPDLAFSDRMAIGPPDDPSGRCVMRPDGDVEVRAPWTSGTWPCLLRVCRDECMIARFTVVSEPRPEAEEPASDEAR